MLNESLIRPLEKLRAVYRQRKRTINAPLSSLKIVQNSFLTKTSRLLDGFAENVPLKDPALLSQAQEAFGVIRLVEQSPHRDRCPLSRALSSLQECSNQLAYHDIVEWISGLVKPTRDMRSLMKKPPLLYTSGENARQYSYLLTSISVLSTLTGYGGLSILIDESEHYSLLRARQRVKADSFFKAMIYAAVPGVNNSRINPNDIPPK